jgi:dienelactone hydrolase
MRYAFAALLLLAGPLSAESAVQTEAVTYQDGETALEGYLAYDDASKDPRPGVLVVHEWKGLNDYAKRRAEQLAGLGYVALAVDMYGKGVRAKDHEEAKKLSGIYRSDRQLMRRRVLAGLEELKRHPLIDPLRIAAIGYCFGGTSVLELARSGTDVAGVVSFHGGLSTPNAADAANIKGQVLVLHGADDTFVPPDEVAAFENEMRQAGVRYQLIRYPGAVHSFTVPEAGNNPSAGMAYNEEADAKSWEEMRKFLREIFLESELKHIGRAGAAQARSAATP